MAERKSSSVIDDDFDNAPGSDLIGSRAGMGDDDETVNLNSSGSDDMLDAPIPGFADAEPSAGFPVLDAGLYQCRVTKSEAVKTQGNNDKPVMPMIKAIFSTQTDDGKKRNIFGNLVLGGDALEISLKHLIAIDPEIGDRTIRAGLSPLAIAKRILGKDCGVRVGVRKRTVDGEERTENDIKEIKPPKDSSSYLEI